MLENPVYMGVVRWCGQDYPGVHEPIVSAGLYEQVQEVMHGRTTKAGFTTAHAFAYRGLMKCAYCGCSITAEIKKGKYIYYRCTGMRDKQCPGMQITREETLTEQFSTLLEGLVLSDENFESLKTALKESLHDESAVRRTQLERITKESAKIREKLERIYLDRIENQVSLEVYESLRERFSSELAILEVQGSALGKAEDSYYDLGVRLLELAQSAPLRFIHADSDTKHKILLELLDKAELADRKVQVWLQEPFDTLLQQNARRMAEGTKDAQNENWYSGRDSNPRPSP